MRPIPPEEFSRVQRAVVLLRLAVALNQDRASDVLKVTLRVYPKRVLMELSPGRTGAELELWSLRKEGDYFREVFVMREIEQMSQAETAECLGIKEETVKTRLHRARGHIEKYLLERAGQGIRTAYSFGDSRCTRIVTIVLQEIAEGRNRGS